VPLANAAVAQGNQAWDTHLIPSAGSGQALR